MEQKTTQTKTIFAPVQSQKERRTTFRFKTGNEVTINAVNVGMGFKAKLMNVSKGGIKIGIPVSEYNPRYKYTSLVVEFQGKKVEGKIIWTKSSLPYILAGISFQKIGFFERLQVERIIKENKNNPE
jgi:hypothetical protein